MLHNIQRLNPLQVATLGVVMGIPEKMNGFSPTVRNYELCMEGLSMIDDQIQAMNDADEKAVQHVLDQLRAHGLSNVTIFAQRELGDDTVHCRTAGYGNWYSRFGQVKSWMLRQEMGESWGGCIL